MLYMCEIAIRTIDEKHLEQANSESRILLTAIMLGNRSFCKNWGWLHFHALCLEKNS